MAGHPFNDRRAHKHERDRVSKIAGQRSEPKHYARGGSVHDDEAEDRALIRKEVKSAALKSDGKAPKHRADKATRRARGGKVKHKSAKTNVNVIVAPSGGEKSPMAAPMAGVAAPPPVAAPPMPPKPPMAAPPPSAPMPPPGLGGMPPRAKGGRVEGKESSADKKGLTGIGDRTPIQHSGNKSDTQNIGRSPVITKATGGPIYANGKPGKQMAPKLPAGAGSGIGRLKKNKIARSQHWEA